MGDSPIEIRAIWESVWTFYTKNERLLYGNVSFVAHCSIRDYLPRR
jgi:hypothetical protein